MDKADLQVVVVAGHHIDEIRLLFANDARNAIAIFVGQQVDVVVRQFVTQDIGAVADAQDTDAHRCRSDDLAVELLVLFGRKALSSAGRNILRSNSHASVNSTMADSRFNNSALRISILKRSTTLFTGSA